jgi:hypothetical protein
MGEETEPEEGEISHHKKMEMIHKKVKLDIEWQERIMKKYYDQKRVESFQLERGDKVYVRRRTAGEKNFNIKTKRPSQKLDCLRIGPYEVEAKLPRDN